VRGLAVVLVLAIAAGPARAWQSAPREAAPSQAPGAGLAELRPLAAAIRVGVAGEPLELTLAETIARVLENNQQLAVQRLQVERAELELLAARGNWDPLLALDGGWDDTVSPATSTLSGALDGELETANTSGGLALGGLLPRGGGSYGLRANAVRQETDNLFLPLSPQYTSTLSFDVTQPLARGLTFGATRYALEVAGRSHALSREELRQGLVEVVALAASTWWDLVAAREAVAVQLAAMEAARLRTESNRRQVAAGLLAEADLGASESQVALYEQGLHQAVQAVAQVETLLKTLMLPDRADPGWGRPLAPADGEPPVPPPPPAVEAAVAAALAGRPELAVLREQEELADLGVRFRRDAARPQVDLLASYGLTGVAGTEVGREFAGFPLSPVQPQFVGDLGDSWSQALDGDFPAVSVALRVGLPLGNRTARAQLRQAEVDREMLARQRAALEQQVAGDVRNALQGLASASAALTAARAAREWQERQLASEERRHGAGLSSSFVLGERHLDVVEARLAEAQAEAALGRSLVALSRATGTLLEDHGVRVAAAP
jgi:outer membrane protein TolC